MNTYMHIDSVTFFWKFSQCTFSKVELLIQNIFVTFDIITSFFNKIWSISTAAGIN